VAAGQVRNVAHASARGVGSVSAQAIVLAIPPTDVAGPTDRGYGLLLTLPVVGALIALAMLAAARLDDRARRAARQRR